jgi:GntR family transcriptional regulator, transcriptional repressor for pyruvate dehydrogenase complex
LVNFFDFGQKMTEAARVEAAKNVGALVRVPKMAELVASDLRRRILRGELVENDALPSESALMERFGVSRPTLREAFRVLESESLISVRRGAHGGARVHLPNADVAARQTALVLEHRGVSMQDVYDARGVIEPGCVAVLAKNRTTAQLRELHAALERSRAVKEDPVRQMQEQTHFHGLIVDMAGNQTLSVLSGMLRHIIDVAHMAHVESDAGTPSGQEAMKNGFAAHERIVKLIEARDGERAERLWRRHLLAADDYLLGGDRTLTVYDLMA